MTTANLQVVKWPVEKLIPYTRNARTHSDEQIIQIAASIAEFGWTNPVLIGPDGIVIAGHARLLAARKLGMTEVPVIVLEHLTETQRRALRPAPASIRPGSSPPTSRRRVWRRWSTAPSCGVSITKPGLAS